MLNMLVYQATSRL